MSYSGLHKPSVLGRLAGWLGPIVAFVLMFWVLYSGSLNVNTQADIAWLFAGLIVSFAIAVCLHEAGHLLVGLGLSQPVRKIRIGTGDTLLGLRVAGIVIQICTNPLGGGAVYFSGLDVSPVGVRIASLVAGPGVNLLAAGFAFGLVQLGVAWLGAFALANMVAFIASAVPATRVEGGRQHRSDGMQLLKLLFRPTPPSAFFEGAEMAPSAQVALVRALEDAVISGAPEVTDEHLLRALNRDAALGALFTTIDLNHRLPPGATPHTSVDGPTPSWSAMTNAIVQSAFRQSRDMGVSRPNAAGICLGLLAVECPAGRLLKDAGITDDALRQLAAKSDAQDSAGPADLKWPDLALERWGTAADQALAFAYRVAAADHSPMVGTQHIVAALVANAQSRSALALARLGFVLERHEPRPTLDTGEDTNALPLLSPQAATAIAGSLWRTGPSSPSGTGEICLGIIDQAAGIGSQIFAGAGVTVVAMERALRSVPRESSEPAGCTASSWPMWQLRASARMGVGRWVDARDDFLVAERAATTDEKRALYRNNAAWAALMSGEASLRAEALEQARAAMAFKSDRPAFIGTYAFALLENGSPAEAAALLEPIAATHPRPRDRANDLCLLAICKARLDKPEDAAMNLQAAREADPKCALLERAQAELDKAAATGIC